jgi:hypothetical protein
MFIMNYIFQVLVCWFEESLIGINLSTSGPEDWGSIPCSERRGGVFFFITKPEPSPVIEQASVICS